MMSDHLDVESALRSLANIYVLPFGLRNVKKSVSMGCKCRVGACHKCALTCKRCRCKCDGISINFKTQRKRGGQSGSKRKKNTVPTRCVLQRSPRACYSDFIDEDARVRIENARLNQSMTGLDRIRRAFNLNQSFGSCLPSLHMRSAEAWCNIGSDGKSRMVRVMHQISNTAATIVYPKDSKALVAASSVMSSSDTKLFKNVQDIVMRLPSRLVQRQLLVSILCQTYTTEYLNNDFEKKLQKLYIGPPNKNEHERFIGSHAEQQQDEISKYWKVGKKSNSRVVPFLDIFVPMFKQQLNLFYAKKIFRFCLGAPKQCIYMENQFKYRN